MRAASRWFDIECSAERKDEGPNLSEQPLQAPVTNRLFFYLLGSPSLFRFPFIDTLAEEVKKKWKLQQRRSAFSITSAVLQIIFAIIISLSYLLISCSSPDYKEQNRKKILKELPAPTFSISYLKPQSVCFVPWVVHPRPPTVHHRDPHGKRGPGEPPVPPPLLRELRRLLAAPLLGPGEQQLGRFERRQPASGASAAQVRGAADAAAAGGQPA
ncbi:hypothetical protein CDAR_28701 [Caerostris darwini]|uniref:Uncharacterized protein n=1 Tax=Caerostris darwini TaxID=1538125 RepID=A0AAV4Q2V6_9ARAC|nr:hypothetical protein CDAR_28701 [Caerostris darwini]